MWCRFKSLPSPLISVSRDHGHPPLPARRETPLQMEMSLTKRQLLLGFQRPSHVCCFSENNHLKTINMPKRHILGWQILLPYSLELADKNVPNLHIMKAIHSLKWQGYVKEQFAWRRFYWYLTKEGVQYLCDNFHLPPEPQPSWDWQVKAQGSGERVTCKTHLRGRLQRHLQRSSVPPGVDKKIKAGAGSATRFQFRGEFGCGYGQLPQ